MISSNNSKYNNEVHVSSIINNFCKWNLQSFINQNHLERHSILQNFTKRAIEKEYAAIHFMQTECFYIDPINKGHLAILYYLHDCLEPNKGWGFSKLKVEEIGSILYRYSHKKLTERQTKRLLIQLEQLGYIHRTRLNRRASYHTFLTTKGYVYLVDIYKKPVKKLKNKSRKR